MPNTIADNLQRLVDAKNDIANAITTMGGTVNEGDGLEEFPADITTIPVGGDSHFASNLVVTTEPGAVVTATKVSIRLNVKAQSGAPITITDGFTTLTGTGTGDWQVFWLPNGGKWTISSTVSGKNISDDLYIDDATARTFDFTDLPVYGVIWSGKQETTLTRTGAAANLDNPNPYYIGNTSYGSPFDHIYPWSEMTTVTIDDNVLVKIPKFYYKVEKNGTSMSFQVSKWERPGFYISPAHRDIGDGFGERDVVYIGRYHCCNSDYKSKTNEIPKVSITRSTARTSIKNLGTGYYLNDFAMFWTIRILYLVEFADWDSQKVIGYGSGNGSSASTMGYTDSMPYHTGIMAFNRTTYGANTQYRYIEGLWDNVFDYCDGIRRYNNNVYIYANPSEYSDTSGGTLLVNGLIRGPIKSFSIPSDSTYYWALYPNETASGYIPDNIAGFSSDSNYNTVLCTGGSFSGSSGSLDKHGLFWLDEYSGANTNSNNYVGARLMYLPSNS